MSLQEARSLRWLAGVAPDAGIVRLKAIFSHANHVCLVMPRLQHSLLDVIVHSASWQPDVKVAQVRLVAAHLLVRQPPGSFSSGSTNACPIHISRTRLDQGS